MSAAGTRSDRKSTRLNSSHTVIYTLSLHDALPISLLVMTTSAFAAAPKAPEPARPVDAASFYVGRWYEIRSEEHTSELQSHSDLHSFPTRRSSDLLAGHDDIRLCRRAQGARTGQAGGRRQLLCRPLVRD